MTRKKKITLGLVGVLLAGLALLTYIRWEVWFGNPPEAPYTAPAVPSRVLLTFGNEGALSRNVSWQCDSVLQTSYLELGDENDTAIIDIPATGEVFASRSGKAAYYVARLTNLNPGECYRYRVVTGGKCSPWYSFVARDAGMNEDFSFLYFGDVQDSLGGIAHREIMKAWREHPEVDFAVFGGDLTERPTDEYWKETFRDLDTGMRPSATSTPSGSSCPSSAPRATTSISNTPFADSSAASRSCSPTSCNRWWAKTKFTRSTTAICNSVSSIRTASGLI